MGEMRRNAITASYKRAETDSYVEKSIDSKEMGTAWEGFNKVRPRSKKKNDNAF